MYLRILRPHTVDVDLDLQEFPYISNYLVFCPFGGFMPKEESFEVNGTVTQALANTRFRVELETGNEVLAHVAGRMRKHFIRILPGDKVKIEMSPYDLTKGRITYRYR